jgi:hypothetical protein
MRHLRHLAPRARLSPLPRGWRPAQNMIDDDHLTWDEPVVENGQWVVRARFLV